MHALVHHHRAYRCADEALGADGGGSWALGGVMTVSAAVVSRSVMAVMVSRAVLVSMARPGCA